MTMRTALLLALFLAQAPRVNAYASWLKCYIDLDDTEVVMSHPLVNPEDAEYDVSVLVAPGDENKQQETDDGWLSEYTYPANTNTTLKVRLQVPPELEKADVQYVIEAESATFTHPVMCEGRRSFAQSYDVPVTLEIDGTSTEKVSLKAAWAKGFEAVKLTPTLILTREGGVAAASEEQNAADEL